jgi:hypothetical protein
MDDRRAADPPGIRSLLRAHQQRAELARRLADRERTRNQPELAAKFADRAKEYQSDAKLVEQITEPAPGARPLGSNRGSGRR